MRLPFFFIILLLSKLVNAQSFTDVEKKIILGGDTSAMLRVVPLSEPAGMKALKAVSKDISFNDPLLPLLKKRMLKSVLDSNGRGVGIDDVFD